MQDVSEIEKRLDGNRREMSRKVQLWFFSIPIHIASGKSRA
jgi:hypothetical protein